ncbi:M28 family peptidase [Elioraea sp.]|uniref:M28 family peptidase n=1 Tax=Elioraea sp. TaxID=2185103 RepID=UPI0025C26795|nr:M28 family peptidase [Elioraea sp.]
MPVTIDHHALWADFTALCDFGGRLCGTEGERAALSWAAQRGAAASGVAMREIPVHYSGWQGVSAGLTLPDGAIARCHPLLRSAPTPPGGLTVEVVDVGRGTPEEFAAHAADLAGRAALVRHEHMFTAGTIHRGRKVEMARAAGAVAFLIAGPLAASLVAGSSGRGEDDAGIPALGLSPEMAARLVRSEAGWPRVTMHIDTAEAPAMSRTLLFDMPGRGEGRVVLSAHLDGHALAESAMDNASGVAAALAVTRALASEVTGWRRGVTLALYSVEEWALTGSAQHVAAMSGPQRAAIALNVNIDTVGVSGPLAALTSGFAGIEPFLLDVAAREGTALRTVRPLMRNSDHANYALAGIPAFRLVSGFDDMASPVRHVLTEADTRDKVSRMELRAAASLAAAIVATACTADDDEVARWRG